MQVQSVLRIRLDLAEVSANLKSNVFFFCPHFGSKFVWQLQKSSFPTRVKIGVDKVVLETQRDHRRKLHYPIHHLSRDITNNIFHSKSK